MRWPDAATVRAAAEVWAGEVAAQPGVYAVGLFGSLARGGWGVGSDVDLVIVVEASNIPFTGRPASFPADALPVPADVIVYTRAEWAQGGSVRLGGGVQWLAGGKLEELLAPAETGCAVAVTHHSAHDWDRVAEHARLVVDTKAALGREILPV